MLVKIWISLSLYLFFFVFFHHLNIFHNLNILRFFLSKELLQSSLFLLDLEVPFLI
jgi:hypothetical protein